MLRALYRMVWRHFYQKIHFRPTEASILPGVYFINALFGGFWRPCGSLDFVSTLFGDQTLFVGLRNQAVPHDRAS